MTSAPPPCRDCGAVVRWVKTRAGKSMPVNPVPDPRGNIAATLVAGGRYVDGRVITKLDPAALGETVFRAHWADCPRGERTTRPKPKPTPTQEPMF